MKPITLDQWIETYKPLPNHLCDSNGGDFGDGCCLFETYGHELDYVAEIQEEHPRRIWTLLDADGKLFVVNGFHTVNRFGSHYTTPCLIGSDLTRFHVSSQTSAALLGFCMIQCLRVSNPTRNQDFRL